MGSDDFFARGATVDKFVHLGGCPVIDSYGEAVTLHVQDQIFAHHRQTNQTNIRSGFHRQTNDLSQETRPKQTSESAGFGHKFEDARTFENEP